MDLDRLVQKAEGQPVARRSTRSAPSFVVKNGRKMPFNPPKTYAATPDEIRKAHAAMRPEPVQKDEPVRVPVAKVQDEALARALALIAKALDRPAPPAPVVNVHLPEQNVIINEAFDDGEVAA